MDWIDFINFSDRSKLQLEEYIFGNLVAGEKDKETLKVDIGRVLDNRTASQKSFIRQPEGYRKDDLQPVNGNYFFDINTADLKPLLSGSSSYITKVFLCWKVVFCIKNFFYF